ncbi:MAG: hypothetical protein LBM18_04825 [Oscillospiraceae bacterium]|jgi:cell division septum initiation protein DivIVA|nr:hypothetical protein [Oscillospiraceae bacterium]
MNEYEDLDVQENLEATELLELLYNAVLDAKRSPLGKDKCMISREETLSLLDDVRAQLPVELSEARRLLLAKDEFIAAAKREADSIRKNAQEEARQLVEEQAVTQAARTRAAEIVTAAENKARDVSRAAIKYVDDALRRTEEAINAALSEVRGSRASWRSAAGSAVSQPQPQPPEFQRILDDED